jgi:methionyl-tRNA formyltransferase
MTSIIIAGGRERLQYVLSRIPEMLDTLSAVIIMKEDEHEEIWSDKIQALLDEKGIPNVTAKSFNNSKVKDLITSLPKSVLLCENWRTMISDEDIEKFEDVIIFHESLLPKYRGFAPLTWPIINGEAETGVSMFYVASDVDAGDIIKQVRIPIEDHDTSFDLFCKTYDVYLELISWLIQKIKNKEPIEGQKQDHSLATFGCMRTLEDSQIDWKDSTQNIYNFIRALAPPFLPGAFTEYDGQRVFIAKAQINHAPLQYTGRIPGRIIGFNGSKVSVLTGDGIIDIESVNINDEEVPASQVFSRMKVKLK